MPPPGARTNRWVASTAGSRLVHGPIMSSAGSQILGADRVLCKDANHVKMPLTAVAASGARKQTSPFPTCPNP